MGGSLLKITNQQLNQLNQFANSAYGVKFGAGKKGGFGVMMQDAGRVVKTRTSWFKSIFSTTKNKAYQAKTQELRRTLGRILAEIRDADANAEAPKATSDALTKLIKDLGLSKSGKTVLAPFSKKLLSRKAVAKVLNKLDDLTGASVKGSKVASVWGRAAETATSLGTYVKTIDENGRLTENGKYEFDPSDLSAQHTKRTFGEGGFEDYVTSSETLVDDLGKVGRAGDVRDEVEMFGNSVSPEIVKGLSRLQHFGSRKSIIVDDKLGQAIGKSLNNFFDSYRTGLHTKAGIQIRNATIKLNSAPHLWQNLWDGSEDISALKGLLLKEPSLSKYDAQRMYAYMKRMMSMVCKEAYRSGVTEISLPFGKHAGFKSDFGLSWGRLADEMAQTFMEALPAMIANFAQKENDEKYDLASSNYIFQEDEKKVSAPEEKKLSVPEEKKVSAHEEKKVAEPEEKKVAEPEEKKVADSGKKRVSTPIEVDEATADAVEKELNEVWARHEANPGWDKALSSWTLKTFMKDAESDIVTALQKLDPNMKFSDEEARNLQTGFERQKEDWGRNVPLWDRFSSVANVLLDRDQKPDFGTVKSGQAKELVKFFREAYEASQTKDIRKDVKRDEVRGQTRGGNTCPIIGMLNAMLTASPESNEAALNILHPKTENGQTSYVFPGAGDRPVCVKVDDVKEVTTYPESLPDDEKRTGQNIWPNLSEFEKAALVAINRQGYERVVPGKTFDVMTASLLFGKGYLDQIGRMQRGVAPKGEFELHAAEIARKLAAGKACVLRSGDHFVAITAVTFDALTHEPSFSVVESINGPRHRQVSRNNLSGGYQLYSEA